MMALLEAREVSKIYQMGSTKVFALDDVSLEVGEGEFVAIQGTSGSGKSTLLNMLGGLDRPTKGEVLFEQNSLAPFNKRQMARYRRHSVGMIFQNFNLIPTMSAAENINLALAFGGDLKPAERDRRAHELLERVGLRDRATHRPTELSGGEQQRVAIARALANRPRILLADQPTGLPGPEPGHVISTVLRDVVRPEAVTAVVATHDPVMLDVADRVVELRDG